MCNAKNKNLRHSTVIGRVKGLLPLIENLLIEYLIPQGAAAHQNVQFYIDLNMKIKWC